MQKKVSPKIKALTVNSLKVLSEDDTLLIFSGPTTAAPPDLVIPAEAIPESIGGGGIIVGETIGGVGGDGVNVIGIGEPGGTVVVSGVGIDVEAVPLTAASSVPSGVPASGARAGAVVGTVLGMHNICSKLLV